MSEAKEQISAAQEGAPAASGESDTPIDSDIRKTGQGTEDSNTDGTIAEEPGGNRVVAGDPNQGTEAR